VAFLGFFISGDLQINCKVDLGVKKFNTEKKSIGVIFNLTDSVIFMSSQFDGFSNQLQEVLISGIRKEEKMIKLYIKISTV